MPTYETIVGTIGSVGVPAALLFVLMFIFIKLMPEIKEFVNKSSELKAAQLKQAGELEKVVENVSRVVEANTAQLAVNMQNQDRVVELLIRHSDDDNKSHARTEKKLDDVSNQHETMITGIEVIKSKIA